MKIKETRWEDGLDENPWDNEKFAAVVSVLLMLKAAFPDMMVKSFYGRDCGGVKIEVSP